MEMLHTFWVHCLFNFTLIGIGWLDWRRDASTVSGPGTGIGASLPTGHVLKIALVTMSHICVVIFESMTLALMSI